MNDIHFEIVYITLTMEAFLALFLLSHLFAPKEIKYRHFFTGGYFILYAFVMILQDIFAPSFFEDTFALFILLHFSMMFLFEIIFCEGKFIFKLFLPLVFISMITLAGSPGLLLNDYHIIPFGKHLEIISHVILILITFFMLHYKLDTSKTYPSSYYVTMIVSPILNIMSFTMLKESYSIFSHMGLIACFTLSLELLIYFMIWQGTDEYSRNTELELINQQQKYQNLHMEELSNIVTDYHQLRHDMKNHFACMDRFLSQEKYPELKNYFYSLSNELYTLDNQIETGNEIVNQVINIKYATAHQLEIPMEIDAVLPKQLPIPNHLLCAVLSNLLDNAIEASEKIKEPKISVKLQMIKSYLSITVKNRIEEWQEESALSHKTTKSKPHLHGLGLRIVQEAVNNYNGISTYEICGDEYMASIMLELEEVP